MKYHNVIIILFSTDVRDALVGVGVIVVGPVGNDILDKGMYTFLICQGRFPPAVTRDKVFKR